MPPDTHTRRTPGRNSGGSSTLQTADAAITAEGTAMRGALVRCYADPEAVAADVLERFGVAFAAQLSCELAHLVEEVRR